MQSSSDHNRVLEDQLKLAETDLQHMEKERQVLSLYFSRTDICLFSLKKNLLLKSIDLLFYILLMATYSPNFSFRPFFILRLLIVFIYILLYEKYSLS